MRCSCWAKQRSHMLGSAQRTPPAHCCCWVQELAAAFRAGDLQLAAELTTQLRYICRIREAIVDKL